MKNPESFDIRVTVVGGGIVGLAIADALCQAGASVTVLERNRVARGATGNSFAWINATSKTSDVAYHRLNAAGVDAWRARAREFGEDAIGLYPRGMIEWLDGANREAAAAMDQAIERLSAWGYPAKVVNRTELSALEPHFDFPAAARGLFAFGDASLDAPRAAIHFRECIRSRGGIILENRSARAILRSNGAVSGVETERDTIPADAVVVAAGPDSNAVLAHLTGNTGFETNGPVGTVPGALVQTPPTAPHLWVRRVVYCEHRGPLHLQPAPEGGLLLGGDDTDDWIKAGHDDSVLRRIETRLLNRAQQLIPALPIDQWRGKCGIRVGVRPMPSDGQSIVGEVPNAPNVFLAATHSGVTLAPVIGALLAERIVSGNQPDLLEPFSPQRFQSPRAG